MPLHRIVCSKIYFQLSQSFIISIIILEVLHDVPQNALISIRVVLHTFNLKSCLIFTFESIYVVLTSHLRSRVVSIVS